MRQTDRCELDLSRLRGILGDDAFLYVNYPFCSKLCGFCIYKLHRYSEAASRRFLSDLAMEASLLADLLDGHRFRNLHVGGGTPNVVPPDALLGNLGRLVDFANLERFVVETSPRVGFQAYLDAIRPYNVTKVQLGVQTLDDGILRQEGRDTTRETILSCIETLEKSDFIWSVDLVYGFQNEERSRRDHLGELDTLLEHQPTGFHLYLMRSEASNRFYGKSTDDDTPGVGDRRKSWEVETFGQAEDKLSEAGYRRVYDEFCRGPNIAHAERTISYDANTGFLPNMVGLGVGAVSHTRIMTYDNVKSLAEYTRLLQNGVMPHHNGADYEATGMFPIAMIYFKIRHGAPVSIPRLTESFELSGLETKQIDCLLELLSRSGVRYRLNRGLLGIPERDYSLALGTIADFLRAGSDMHRSEEATPSRGT